MDTANDKVPVLAKNNNTENAFESMFSAGVDYADAHQINLTKTLSGIAIASVFGFYTGRLWRHRVCAGNFCQCRCTNFPP